jgi:hypothetical protein
VRHQFAPPSRHKKHATNLAKETNTAKVKRSLVTCDLLVAQRKFVELATRQALHRDKIPKVQSAA